MSTIHGIKKVCTLAKNNDWVYAGDNHTKKGIDYQIGVNPKCIK